MEDNRSHKVAFVAHCLLNQNAKVSGLAHHPAMIDEVVELLRLSDVGIVQMPCPEFVHFGLGRPLGNDTREQYDIPQYREACAVLSDRITSDIKEYTTNGCTAVCILGVEGSPSCSVSACPSRQGQIRSSGVFMESLIAKLGSSNLSIPVIGIPESGDLGKTLAEIGRICATP